MKLRLVSRLIVVTLVVVVALIIIIHQLVTAGNTSHPAHATPSATLHSFDGFSKHEWAGDLMVHGSLALRNDQFALPEQARPVWTAYPVRVVTGNPSQASLVLQVLPVLSAA